MGLGGRMDRSLVGFGLSPVHLEGALQRKICVNTKKVRRENGFACRGQWRCRYGGIKYEGTMGCGLPETGKYVNMVSFLSYLSFFWLDASHVGFVFKCANVAVVAWFVLAQWTSLDFLLILRRRYA